MPLDKFVLILVIVVCAAGASVALGAWLVASAAVPWLGFGVAIPIGLIGYVIVRVIADRLRNGEDDHYDKVEK